MRYIEPHAHMVSRVTDDYSAMVTAGCRAVCEPAFWAGFDRSSVQGFRDYFCQLTEYEPRRSAQYGLPHYSWLCLNPKEAEDLSLSEEVLALIPSFLDRPNVMGIGEIGLNKNSRNEVSIFEKHVDLAVRHDQMMLIHTPHLEDKWKGTHLIVDILKNHSGVKPGRVIIDHVEEHTVEYVLDAGFWAGITLYPLSKCTSARAIDLVEIYGTQRIWINSACDWGNSDPLAIPKTAILMKRHGHGEEVVDKLIYQNPLQFLSQNPKFHLDEIQV